MKIRTTTISVWGRASKNATVRSRNRGSHRSSSSWMQQNSELEARSPALAAASIPVLSARCSTVVRSRVCGGAAATTAPTAAGSPRRSRPPRSNQERLLIDVQQRPAQQLGLILGSTTMATAGGDGCWRHIVMLSATESSRRSESGHPAGAFGASSLPCWMEWAGRDGCCRFWRSRRRWRAGASDVARPADRAASYRGDDRWESVTAIVNLIPEGATEPPGFFSRQDGLG